MTPWKPLPRPVPITSTRSPFAKIDTSTWSPVFSASPPAASFNSRRIRVGGTFAALKCPFVGLFVFAGGAATHGSMFHRAPGSIGASSFPSRVIKGMRAAGRMGGKRVTTRNLKVVSVDADQHLLVLRGAVPGAPNGVILVRRAVARKPDPKPQIEKKKGKK